MIHLLRSNAKVDPCNDEHHWAPIRFKIHSKPKFFPGEAADDRPEGSLLPHLSRADEGSGGGRRWPHLWALLHCRCSAGGVRPRVIVENGTSRWVFIEWYVNKFLNRKTLKQLRNWETLYVAPGKGIVPHQYHHTNESFKPEWTKWLSNFKVEFIPWISQLWFKDV